MHEKMAVKINFKC